MLATAYLGLMFETVLGPVILDNVPTGDHGKY